MKAPNPESATTIAPAIVKPHVRVGENLAGQFTDLTPEEIESGETGTKRNDRATALT
jgi:hypothetical protein